MRYFTHNFVELEELPNDVSLLVRAEGTSFVELIQNALRDLDVPYVSGASRKDEVNFYVHSDQRDEVEKTVRSYLANRKH